MSAESQHSTAVYAERAARFAAARDRYQGQWERVGNARLGAFVAAALVGGWGLLNGVPPAMAVSGVLLVGFVALVRYHNGIDRQRKRYAGLWQISDEAGRRVARTWATLPLRHTPPGVPGHPYAADLDIFGRASLFQLLEAMGTAMGEATLTAWLLAPAPPATIRERQAAVAELAPQIDLRDELSLRGRLAGDPRPDPAPFLAWAEGPAWIAPRRRLVWAVRLNLGLLWIAIILSATGTVAYPIWLPFMLVSGVFLQGLVRPATEILERVSSSETAFGPYAEAMELIDNAQFVAPALRRVQSTLTAGGLQAHRQMHRLHRLVTLGYPADTLLYLPMQLLSAWDLHVLTALEGWQQVAGHRARAWLDALGEAEALAALAVLKHDNPDWAFPEIDPATPALVAAGLGHPLLPAATRVGNDVTVGPAGTFLLVTGSNMSGKSTLLRALGTNLVLAGAGGPVCATAFHAPPVEIWTSMRIQDSLEQGVSYFMAELRRLKAVVDAARRDHAHGERGLFYLLDEILQGTNTAERQIAARRIILYLVAEGALGAVSTHDLTLTDAPAVAAAARPIHFTEHVTSTPSGPVMSFDYQARPGIATSTNALRLMEIVGLDLESDP